MSLSNATVTPNNISLTPVRVNFNGVDLGGTHGDVAVNMKYDLADIMVDQFGKTPLDKVVSGHVTTVKLVLAEIKNIDNWKVAFPSIHEIVNGGTKSAYSDLQIGDHLSSHAQILILHPMENADANLNNDFKFYKAVAMNAAEIKYGPEKQLGLAVEFIILPDTSVTPAKFFTYGDPTNGIVHASAGSATPGSNTGNGTLDTISVADGFTVTETITVQCVGASSGNDFNVTGSVSGALGSVHIAAGSGSTVAFVNNKVNFTLHQGTVQYVYHDSFTIALTGSNYA